jgi:hypothetical protein
MALSFLYRALVRVLQLVRIAVLIAVVSLIWVC